MPGLYIQFSENCFKEIPTLAKLHIGSELDVSSRKQKEKFPQNFYPNVSDFLVSTRLPNMNSRTMYLDRRTSHLLNYRIISRSVNGLGKASFVQDGKSTER
jgi:hypothetical protein